MLTALGEHASRALVTPDVPAPPQHACSKPQAWHRAATATNNGAGDPHKHTVRPCWLRPAVKSSDSECPRAMLTALGEHASRALVTPDVQAPNMLAQSRKHGTRPQRLPTMARVIHITTPCATAGFAQQRNPVIQNVPVPCSQLWVSMPPPHWSLRTSQPPQHACSKPQAWHRAATDTNNGTGDPHNHTVCHCPAVPIALQKVRVSQDCLAFLNANVFMTSNPQ